MIAAVPVVKYNGTRNAFVLVDARTTPLADPVAFARRICADPAFAADGLLLALPSHSADVRMRIVNADGSEAEMCGNGMRCFARYVDETDGRAELTVETFAGPIRTRIVERSPDYRVSVELNEPAIGAEHEIAGFHAIPVDVGNPHVVIFVADPDAIDLATVGPLIERDPRYPHGTNVHFVARTGPSRLRVRHWERGAGATQACGTGAVACAAVAIARDGDASPVELHVPGGVLSVAWRAANRPVMTGDAVREFATTV